MEKKIRSLYITDNLIVLVSVVAIWCCIGFVLTHVLKISTDQTFSSIAIGSGIAALAALTATSVALVMHLKKNKTDMYTEELENQSNG